MSPFSSEIRVPTTKKSARNSVPTAQQPARFARLIIGELPVEGRWEGCGIEGLWKSKRANKTSGKRESSPPICQNDGHHKRRSNACRSAHEQIGLPFSLHRSHHVLDKGNVVRAERTEQQPHPHFVGRAVPLSVVAPHARTDQILPRVAATA